MINGIIFQRDDNRDYKGVEGDNWYLNNIFPELFEDFFGGKEQRKIEFENINPIPFWSDIMN